MVWSLTKVFHNFNNDEKQQRSNSADDRIAIRWSRTKNNSYLAKLFKTRAFAKRRILNRCQKHHKANRFAAGRFVISRITLWIQGSRRDGNGVLFLIERIWRKECIVFAVNVMMACGIASLFRDWSGLATPETRESSSKCIQKCESTQPPTI